MRALVPFAALLLVACAAGQQQGPAPSVASLQGRANTAEQHGEFDAAADLFVALVQQEPEQPKWVLAAGRCLGRAGRFNQALDLLDQKRKQFPDLLDLPALLARTYLLKVETDPACLHPEVLLIDAAELCKSVLLRDPDHTEAILILAQVQYDTGDLAAAAATAKEASERHPQHPGAAVMQGRIAADRFRALHRQLREGGRSDAVLQQLDVERKAAQAAYQRAATIDPLRPFPLLAQAELAMWDDDLKSALDFSRRALVLDPGARANHAWIEQQLDWQGRRDFYSAVLQDYAARPAPDAKRAATLHFYLGRALYDGAVFKAAKTEFAVVLRDNPEHINAAYYAAFCAYRDGEHDEAERFAALYAHADARAFADVLRLLPQAARDEAAAVLKFLGDRAYQLAHLEPSRDLNHVLACLFDSVDAWNNYAFLCRETKAYEEGLDAYLSALQKEPDSPQLLNDAAVILQYHLPNAANLERAKGMYERAVQLAEQRLADPAVSAEQKQRATKARSDAQLNLQKLAGG